MPTRCPRCGRPVAAARPQCLYCGQALPESALPTAPTLPGAPQESAPVSTRVLLVLDLARADAGVVSAALGLSAYEAAQRVRSGGFQLHRVVAAEAAETERARLIAAGLDALAIPEQEVLAATAPRLVTGGRNESGALALRLETGDQRVARGDVRCLVRGPIARQYQTDAAVRRLHAATLTEGYRIHLYSGDEPRPLELDPAAFDFSGAVRRGGSSQLELLDWIGQVAGDAVVDAAFSRMPPALAPAHMDALAHTAALLGQAAPRASGSGRDQEGRVILDNLAQFRYYSGWRAAAARRTGR